MITYIGDDGVDRDLEEHRAYLQARLDASVDRGSPFYDPAETTKLVGKLRALPPPQRRPPPRLHVIVEGDDVAAVQALRRAAHTNLQAIERGELTGQAAAVLRALLTRASVVRPPTR